MTKTQQIFICVVLTILLSGVLAGAAYLSDRIHDSYLAVIVGFYMWPVSVFLFKRLGGLK